MRFNILISAIAMLPLLLTSCDSSKSTDSGSDTPINLTGIDDWVGIANGKVTLGGKSFPIEFTADAYSKRVSLTGFTDLAHQDSGWQVFFSAKASLTSPQDINEGLNQAVLSYGPSWDSTVCAYSSKAGTVTIESFIAKKSGTKNYFTTSGKASFTATKSQFGNYSSITCPDISVEVVFTKVNVYDSGLNL